MTNDERQILKDARRFVQQAHDEAESKHDSYGELYMDSVQYEIMRDTELLLARIDEVLT